MNWTIENMPKIEILGIDISYPIYGIASHMVIDKEIGEHGIGKSEIDFQGVTIMTMFFATPEQNQDDFLAKFFWSCIVPDLLIKNMVHPESKPMFPLNKDQTLLLENLAVIFYVVDMKF